MYISQKVGQPVVVENKTGASGAIAAVQVKIAPADGYTLMFTIATTMIMNKALFKTSNPRVRLGCPSAG
jgi:tripartite-type tricarboxylate transporter receptor subunit TctC